MEKINITHTPNQFVAFFALLKSSLISSFRNPESLFFNFLFPFIFISVFGALNFGSTKIDILVTSDSLKEGILYEAIKKVDTFNLITDKSEEAILEDLNKGRAPVSITISENGVLEYAPNQFMPRYTLVINKSAADPQTSNSVASILLNILDSINLSITQSNNLLLNSEINVIEGRKFNQIDFILPGQLAFALLMNALFGISYTFMTFRKELILKRYFASPVKKVTILASEVTSKAIIALAQSIIIITAGHYLFKFTLANGFETVMFMLILSMVGTFTFLGFGLLIPALAKNEDAVAPIAQIIMMPQLFLSGAFFPLEAFPDFVQVIAKYLPMTYLNEAFKIIAFEGLSLSAVTEHILALLIWGVVLYVINIFLFKWE